MGKIKNENYLMNEEIGSEKVRVLSAIGEQMGVMSSKEALRLAQEEGLDLIQIVANAQPPVCKIIDYSKFKYELGKKEKEVKKKQKVNEVKEIRLSPGIDKNDINTKQSQARKLLAKGNKVKVVLQFHGREFSHMQQSRHILDDFISNLSDVAVAEKAPRVENRSLSAVLVAKNKK